MRASCLLGLAAVCVVTGVGAMAACGGVSGGIGPADDGGLEGAAASDGSATSDDDGGQPITDGGSNLDPDAGEEEDGGTDAGCNTLANEAPAVNSDCISVLPGLPGGPLVAGKYHLVAVNALGSPGFCRSTFRPVSIKETMDLAVAADGTGTAELAVQIGGGPGRTRTSVLDPGPNDSSPMQATQTCPPRNGASVQYASAMRNGRQHLVMLLSYGQGQALYRFDKQ